MDYKNIPGTNEYAQWQAGEFPPKECDCDQFTNYHDLCDDCQDDVDNGIAECPCRNVHKYDDLCPSCKKYVDGLVNDSESTVRS